MESSSCVLSPKYIYSMPSFSLSKWLMVTKSSNGGSSSSRDFDIEREKHLKGCARSTLQWHQEVFSIVFTTVSFLLFLLSFFVRNSFVQLFDHFRANRATHTYTQRIVMKWCECSDDQTDLVDDEFRQNDIGVVFIRKSAEFV